MLVVIHSSFLHSDNPHIPLCVFYAALRVMGIAVPALEPAWMPVINYLVPHIVHNVQDPNDTNLLLLREVLI